MDDLVRRHEPLRRGDTLYRAGDRFAGIFAIQHGAIKTYGLTLEGREQITGFHLAGELVGLDAIDTNTHPCNAIALEDTEVCLLPLEQLEALSQRIPGLLHNFSRLMSREILREEHVLMMLGGTSAEQRIARFLLNLQQRLSERGPMGDEIHLLMSRQDISNYLGLAIETVSRQFTHLQEKGILEINNRSVRVLDRTSLAALVG